MTNTPSVKQGRATFERMHPSKAQREAKAQDKGNRSRPGETGVAAGRALFTHKGMRDTSDVQTGEEGTAV